MREVPCPACGGARLNPVSMAVTVNGLNIFELCRRSIRKTLEVLESLELGRRDATIAEPVIKEIRARLRFLLDVGLDYLTLYRGAATLSGGEAQRIRLATQIGSGLVGVLYVLDEPSIGLHQRDNRRLLETLLRLRDLGNTLIVVEHDEETIRTADYVVDLGPGAGEHGGHVVAEGDVAGIIAEPTSITGDYLAGRRRIPTPDRRREGDGRTLTVVGAAENNLRNLDVTFPLGKLIAVTGVSGSGKSSLVQEILSKALHHKLYRSRAVPGRPPPHRRRRATGQGDQHRPVADRPNPQVQRRYLYEGVRPDQKALLLDPGGKGPRLPARPLLLQRPGRPLRGPAGVTGTSRSRCISFPTSTFRARCARVGGTTATRSRCSGKARSIADVLNMPVEEALAFFEAQAPIARILQTIYDVGLGYIRLGQPAPTLSGGEAQRVKLASELGKASHRQHPVHPRRAHHRTPLRGHPPTAAGPASAGGRRKHGRHHRAQPRRGPFRRLADRHGTRRRRRGWADSGAGNARTGDPDSGVLHGQVPARRPLGR